MYFSSHFFSIPKQHSRKEGELGKTASIKHLLLCEEHFMWQWQPPHHPALTVTTLGWWQGETARAEGLLDMTNLPCSSQQVCRKSAWDKAYRTVSFPSFFFFFLFEQYISAKDRLKSPSIQNFCYAVDPAEKRTNKQTKKEKRKKRERERNLSEITLSNFPADLQKEAFILLVVHVSSESKRPHLIPKQVTLVI